MVQIEFNISKANCKKLYYRYTVSHTPEMLFIKSRKYEDVENCYRVLSIPKTHGTYVCAYIVE